MSPIETPERNLAFDLVRVTESAAISAARWLGKGDKNAGDKAAVDAMRIYFNTLPIVGTIIIGEGEKDEAPMLYNGEQVGLGFGYPLDIAVDPVEGTNLLAFGRPNAIAVVGAAPAGSMYDPGPSFYMQKLVVASAAKDVIDLDAPIRTNLHHVAKALGKAVNDLIVFVLDKPRHKQLISDIRTAGARIQLHTDGDVAGALMAVDPRSDIDLMIGTGGTPEGVLSACAIKGIGGGMLARLDPQSVTEKKAIEDAGIDSSVILGADDLVKANDVFFAATGISGGTFLQGVNFHGHGATTHSIIIRSKTGTVRYLQSFHNWEKLMQISVINYDSINTISMSQIESV